MRLWHKYLIPVLPKQQLLGQWRECCCIARNIEVDGTPNHILVNKVLDYPIEHFVVFTGLVYKEMQKRGYKANLECFTKHLPHDFDDYSICSLNRLFKGWHNDRYLNQCYYNLQEKYDCGGITEEEWDKIVARFVNVF